MKLSILRFLPVIGSVWYYLLACHSTAAQIVPDGTLPGNSRVIPQGNTSLIEGGTTIGSNLFHSFGEFSVPTGGTAYFNNALDIQNIFTRITGSNISNIDGLIKANGVTNLFLLNPNGIIFGANARLNIGGSFLATTASSYRFAEGIEFSATNLQTAPILTVNVPIGLQFGSNPGQIVNRSRVTATAANGSTLPVGLQVQPEKTLALIGGDIQLEGGFLSASAGTIELGSVKDSFVNLSPNMIFEYSNATKFGDILLSEGAGVITSGIGGGSIQIRGGKVTLQEGSTLVADTLGNLNGGGINIQATQLSLADNSYISTTTLAEGTGGNINVSATEKVELTGIGVEEFQQIFVVATLSGLRRPTDRLTGLFAGSEGEGKAGDITIDAPALLLQKGAWIGNDKISSANAGNLSIRAADSVELVGSGITTTALLGSAGSSGEIFIDTRSLIVRDASYITTTTFGSARAGNIALKVSESVELLRTPDGSMIPTLIASNSLGTGSAGDITIDTQRLIVRNGAGAVSSGGGRIGNRVLPTGGAGGSLTVRASEEVEVSGISGVLSNGSQISSFLSSATFTPFPGGNVSITTRRLAVKDGGVISIATLNAGKAGEMMINASQTVEISGATGQFRSTVEASSGSAFSNQNREATGDGGSVTLNAPELIVSDRGRLNVSSLGSGKAGNLRVVVDAMRLENGAELNAATGSGAGGNIILQTQSLQLRRQSQINTNAGNADGGNININTDTLTALENSDITANALSGRGGQITITARGIFGVNSRSRTQLETLLNSSNLDPSQLPTSDITAISQQDAPQFQGNVTINTPDVNPGYGLVDLPENIVDTTSLVASSCSRSKKEGSSFIISGRGGLPPSPTEPLDVEATWADLRIIILPLSNRENIDRPIRSSHVLPTATEIVEASGWIHDADGNVVLTANVPSVTPLSLNQPTCVTSQ